MVTNLCLNATAKVLLAELPPRWPPPHPRRAPPLERELGVHHLRPLPTTLPPPLMHLPPLFPLRWELGESVRLPPPSPLWVEVREAVRLPPPSPLRVEMEEPAHSLGPATTTPLRLPPPLRVPLWVGGVPYAGPPPLLLPLICSGTRSTLPPPPLWLLDWGKWTLSGRRRYVFFYYPTLSFTSLLLLPQIIPNSTYFTPPQYNLSLTLQDAVKEYLPYPAALLQPLHPKCRTLTKTMERNPHKGLAMVWTQSPEEGEVREWVCVHHRCRFSPAYTKPVENAVSCYVIKYIQSQYELILYASNPPPPYHPHLSPPKKLFHISPNANRRRTTSATSHTG